MLPSTLVTIVLMVTVPSTGSIQVVGEVGVTKDSLAELFASVEGVVYGSSTTVSEEEEATTGVTTLPSGVTENCNSLASSKQ